MFLREKEQFYKRFIATALGLAVAVCVRTSASAATLSISPSAQNVSAGKLFSVRVVVDSQGQSINAVSGGVTFSNDLLTLVGVSKASSIISLWAQAPTYSNTAGSASFQGVILNGYTGSSGTVLTLTFRAKAEGTASVGLAQSGSSVLLNDGQGTNVLSSTGADTITITKATTSAVTPTPTPVPQPVVTPPAIQSNQVPVFTEYQTLLVSNNYIVAKGTATPGSVLTTTLTQTNSNGTATVTQGTITANSAGVFTYVSDNRVGPGAYSLVVATSDGQTTSPIHITVRNPLLFVILSWIAIILSIKMPLFFALLIFLLIIWYFWHKNRVLRRHLNDALKKIEQLENK